DVTVESRKYEPVTEEDIRAELMVGSVNGAGDYDLEIRVSKRSGKEFEIIPTSKRTERVYFDTVKERTFELTPQLLGEVQVPEGYYADTVRLLPKTVRVYGAVTELNRISQIAAQIDVSEPLTETTEFPELPILCMNEFGDILGMYLTIEDGTAVSATIPVWKQANLQTGVEFRQAHVNYLNHPLPYKITPASVRAALPESSIPADRFSVGAVSFQELSPGANRFTFSVGEQTDIHYFGNVTQFAVEVDMSGMAEVSFTLPGTGISAVAGEDAPAAAAAFGNVARVRVVGPEAVVKELSPESLSGEVAITAETPAGSSVQPVTVRVARDDCWIFGAYETTVVLTEE
ncbi:MAG: hypothetical protein FWH26_05700, partial [Oscillospiraceae bacterium]|nr:hypothetical protein [Oscillospiraceae bacterium]